MELEGKKIDLASLKDTVARETEEIERTEVIIVISIMSSASKKEDIAWNMYCKC